MRRGFLKEDIMSKGINSWLTGELSVDDVYLFAYLCVCLHNYYFHSFTFQILKVIDFYDKYDIDYIFNALFLRKWIK